MKTPKREIHVGQKWRLKFGKLYAGLTPQAEIVLTTPEKAQVFDSRDDQQFKSKFYALVTGLKFEVENVKA